jgi:hypothetical protein
MTAMLAKIGMGIVMRLVTESFAGKMLVYGLQQISKSTNNQLDDKITSAVAEALGVKID